MEKTRIKIDSTGKIFAGEYSEIIINGSGKFEGESKSERISINGAGKAYAPVETQFFSVNGIFKGEDTIKADTLEVNGSFKGEKDVRVNKLYIDGMFKNEEGYLNAEYIEVNGTLKNEMEINTDKLVVNGLLKAVDIVGRDIAILKGMDLVSLFKRNLNKKVLNKAETITCENLYARALKCTKICADDITLKDGCVVEFVECNGTLRVDSSCIVKNVEGTCEIIHEYQ